MKRSIAAALGVVGAVAGAVALWTAWGISRRRSVEEVPYDVVERRDGVEVREYPRTVLAETTAPDERTAFRRLFRYIDGENDADADVAMTAPVETTAGGADPGGDGGIGASIPMTAPVRTDDDGGAVRMAFYLPTKYDRSTAPVPTDPSVRLVVEPPRTVAARQFSWFATDGRVRRAREELLEALSAADVDARGDPSLLRYDDPRVPPWVRTNEVVVEVDRE